MAILVLGGRGKLATALASHLKAANLPFLVGTHSSPNDSTYVHFDWTKNDTWKNAFDRVYESGMSKISGVFIAGASIMDIGEKMVNFIDLAKSQGVKRFVLISASNLEKGGTEMGQAHEHLADLDGIEYAVLRPTWFMENFLESPHLDSIKNESIIYSAAGDGKIPFISIHDISRLALHALTDAVPLNRDLFVLGPECVTHTELASLMTSVVGRQIKFVSLNEAELANHLVEGQGVPLEFAQMIAALDHEAANGTEERLGDEVEKLTGVAPKSFADFCKENKECWI
ncbi:ergot alkaloid A [Penicillium macrosclerotiorum]|uniref:ergot alkaloid A n=1 Tax=Penicillium macrosclerotiorum TaxID=303699 RepID=UPI0025485DBD|nr:ergot alkaloid A [Penicillium macrosclerotiorum]KAJ5683102.1 ergot alkaloid A [Penicillium macrosclerotiorum]